MNGESDLPTLLKSLKPKLNEGKYAFCLVQGPALPVMEKALFLFREEEGITIVLPQADADALGLPYQYISAWITLTVHSALEAVGLTAAFSTALAEAGISCNVVAACHHDHIFVDPKSAPAAMEILHRFSEA